MKLLVYDPKDWFNGSLSFRHLELDFDLYISCYDRHHRMDAPIIRRQFISTWTEFTTWRHL